MLKSGLVSISFRELSVDQIIDMVSTAQLEGIEWGGDIHVPHGNVAVANEVYLKCKSKNITCPSYGSYYKIGTYENFEEEFSKVLNCALALHCQTIRVWAGILSTKESNDQHFSKIVEETKRICQMASNQKINIAFEFHGGTLTDNALDTKKLLQKANMANLYTYWQPPVGSKLDDNMNDIKLLFDYISNLHVFQWDVRDRLPLKEGISTWEKYIAPFKKRNSYCLLEFVQNNSTEQFYEDAATLKELLHG